MTPTRALLSAFLLLTVLLVPAAPAVASGDWQGVIDITFPVTGDDYRYMDDYSYQRSRGAHGATDIMAPAGTPIVAAQSGTVTWVSTPSTSGCGYCLDIETAAGRTHGYIHLGPKSSGRDLEAFSRRWQRGDKVQRGEVIGYVGCSGNASCGGGEQLHFLIEDPGVTDPYGDNRRNPYPSLRAAERGCDTDGPFSDVCSDSVHAGDIARLANASLTSGCGDDLFCPSATVTRAQMASFLVRALELTPSDSFPFRDVGTDNVHHRTIARLAAEEITRGCDSNRYCPEDQVTRAQMASFLARALQLPASSSATFSDVSSSNVHRRDISALAAAGITKGCGDGSRFCPEAPVTREQMASFLVRAFLD